MVYSYLNFNDSQDHSWEGWNQILCLHIAPSVKHFIWLLFKGKIQTQAYLYSLNLGPQSSCVFCGLKMESTEHLFKFCPKIQVVWIYLGRILNKNIQFLDEFSADSQLTYFQSSSSLFLKSIIASRAWYNSKARCSCIFKSQAFEPSIISSKAIAHVMEFTSPLSCYHGKCLLLNNFVSSDGSFLFTAGILKGESIPRGLGFIVVNHNSFVLLARSCPTLAESDLIVEAKALLLALNIVTNQGTIIHHIFTASKDLCDVVYAGCGTHSWRNDDWVHNIIDILAQAGNPDMSFVPPRSQAVVAKKLAMLGSSLHDITLYHHRRDQPCWIFETFFS